MTFKMKIQNLTIKLVGSTPVISRKLQVPVQMNLHELHQLIQYAMPWGNCHMYEFHCQGKEYWREAEDDVDDEFEEEFDEEFDDLFEQVSQQWSVERFLTYTKAKKFHYVYDFGDHWDHLITVGAIEDANPNEIYPKLIAANGLCPPEDIGGIQHYYWALEIINEPEHENHEETLGWFDDDFDPNVDVFPSLVKEVAKFAIKFQQ